MSQLSRVCINVAGVSIEIETPERQPLPSYTFHVGDVEQANLEGIVVDETTGLMWSQDDVRPKKCTHEAAAAACKDLRLGGFDDWRLPTRVELLTLVDDTRHDPAIDTERFPSCKSAWYWTSTPLASSSGFAWLVDFGSGDAGGDHRDSSYGLARAVRSVAPGQ